MRGIVIYKDDDYRLARVEQVMSQHGMKITDIIANEEIYKAVNRVWEERINKVTYDEKLTFNYVPSGKFKIVGGCGWNVIYRESEEE